jgi:hypothetical protein
VTVWLNDGEVPPGWTRQSVAQEFRGARSLTPADLDLDGDVDLIGAALDDDEISWWRNDGGSPILWSRIVLSDEVSGAHHADAWDLDLDGDLDVLAAGYADPRLELFRNDGGDPPAWSREHVGGLFRGALVVGVGDLDGDGDRDVVATSDTRDRVTWWRNDGSAPESWPAVDIATGFDNAWPVVVGDVDGNGAVDVVAGASGASEVAWWRLSDFVTAGRLTSRPLAISEDVVSLSGTVDASIPDGTRLVVEVRFGSSPDSMGQWRELVPGAVVVPLMRGPTLLQYRVSMTTDDPSVAPILREIAFDWSSDSLSPRSPGGRVGP